MPTLPVDIYVFETGDRVTPISGVVVRIFNSAGTLIETQAVSDTEGRAACALPTESSPYVLRCYKRGVAFGQQHAVDITVVGPNVFDLYGTPMTRPLSQDPRVCVAFGNFVDATKSPHAGLEIHFMPKFSPLIIDGDAVMKERTIGRTDRSGYMEVPLIRFARYDVTIAGMEEVTRTISVPDAFNVNLPDLLFAQVDRVDFTPAPGYALTVGQELTITPVVRTSAAVVLPGTARTDVRWSSSDPDVLAVTVLQDTLLLRGMRAGSAQLVAERYDNTIIRIPSRAIAGVPVNVTVT